MFKRFNYTDIAKKMFKVDPLPQGAVPVYGKEPVIYPYTILRGTDGDTHIRPDLDPSGKTMCGALLSFPEVLHRTNNLDDMKESYLFPVCSKCMELAKSREIVEE